MSHLVFIHIVNLERTILTILTRKNVELQIALKTLIQLISWRIHIGLLQIHQRQRTSNTILAAKNHTLTLHLTYLSTKKSLKAVHNVANNYASSFKHSRFNTNSNSFTFRSVK